MVSLDRCRRKAKRRAFLWCWGNYVIVNEYETDDEYVFGLGSPDGRTVWADLPLLVCSKDSGRLRMVREFTAEGHEIARRMRPL